MADFILRDLDPEELRADIIKGTIAAVRKIVNEASQPQLVDGDRMANLLGVSRPTIDRLVRDDLIPSVMVGSRRRYEPRSVIDDLKALRDREADQ